MNTKRNLLQYALIVLSSLFFLLSTTMNARARENKDLLLVLDTSYSMVGHGGKNILPQVKESLNTFIDKLEEGDSFSFITFDTEVRMYPTVYISDENDRAILRKYISMVEAKGKWTYTMEMLRGVFKRAQELQDEDSDRQQIIVILSDTLDDPPPEKRNDQLSLKQLEAARQGNEWFIYFVNIRQLKEKTEKMSKFKQELTKEESPYTKVIEGDGSPEKALEKVDTSINEMMEEKERRESSSWLIVLLIVCLIVAALLALLWYLNKVSKIVLFGKLEYRDTAVISQEPERVDLARFQKRKIRIGNNTDNDIVLSNFEAQKPIILEAISFDGNIKVRVAEEKGLSVVYDEDKKESFLGDGDTFHVFNMSFTYYEE